ncbi:MAG: ATP-binding protein [Epsilonproteobacteria bacterium]|nr:ATP-binding protein [Campylobacterota bacterium]
MNQYETAKHLFKDDFDLDGYLNSLTFEYAKKSLVEAMSEKDVPLIFVLGNPGSGKSFLLNFVSQKVHNVKVAKYFTHPYFDDKEFLEILLSMAGKNIERNEYTTEKLISQLRKNFSDLEYTVFIDEAQLLTEEQIELIRILSDQKIFQFVLAMHKKEGHFILQKDHFKSRTIKVIEVEALQDHEVARYIEDRLISNNLSDLASQFHKKQIKMINNYAKRNFRTTKKLLKILFEIMHIADSKKLNQKYLSVNERTVTMAAIDIGLIDVK